MPTPISSRQSLTNLPKLGTNTPKLPTDIYITRVESADSELEDGLSYEEFRLDRTGLVSDQIRYIAQHISYEHPDIPSKTIYSAVGTAIKRYSFRSVLLATKTVNKLDDATLFPRFIYACKSFYATEKSRIDTSQLTTSMKKREDSEKLRALLKTPEDTLFSLLLEGSITKEQYNSVKDSDEKCRALIKEVVMNDTGGTT